MRANTDSNSFILCLIRYNEKKQVTLTSLINLVASDMDMLTMTASLKPIEMVSVMLSLFFLYKRGYCPITLICY